MALSNRFHGMLFFVNRGIPKICGVIAGPNMVQSAYKKKPFSRREERNLKFAAFSGVMKGYIADDKNTFRVPRQYLEKS